MRCEGAGRWAGWVRVGVEWVGVGVGAGQVLNCQFCCGLCFLVAALRPVSDDWLRDWPRTTRTPALIRKRACVICPDSIHVGCGEARQIRLLPPNRAVPWAPSDPSETLSSGKPPQAQGVAPSELQLVEVLGLAELFVCLWCFQK